MSYAPRMGLRKKRETWKSIATLFRETLDRSAGRELSIPMAIIGLPFLVPLSRPAGSRKYEQNNQHEVNAELVSGQSRLEHRFDMGSLSLCLNY